jgi:WD40 repeat protein
MISTRQFGARDSMAGFDFNCLAEAQPPIAGLFWDSSCAAIRVFEQSGGEFLIDMAGCSTRVGALPCTGVSLIARRPHCQQSAILDADRRLTITGDNRVPAVEDVQQVEWSPCGRYLAILHEDKVDVWNSEKRKMVTSRATWDPIQRIAWRPQPPSGETQLALAARCGFVIWSADGNFNLQFQQAPSETSAFAWDPTGTCLVRACDPGGLQVWNAQTNKRLELDTFDAHPMRQLAWACNGATLAGVSTHCLVTWNIRGALHDERSAGFVLHPDSPISRMVFRPGGSILATGNIHGALELWRPVKAGKMLRSADLGASVTHMVWSTNGKHLVAATSSGRIYAARLCR